MCMTMHIYMYIYMIYIDSQTHFCDIIGESDTDKLKLMEFSTLLRLVYTLYMLAQRLHVYWVTVIIVVILLLFSLASLDA